MKRDLIEFFYVMLKFGGMILVMFVAVMLLVEIIESMGFVYVGSCYE